MRTIIKLSKTVLLITATQFLFSGTCKKEGSKPCAMATPYSFNVTSEFLPQKEIYNVGDSIFLRSSFPKQLINLISNQQVDYSNSLGVGGNCNFGVLDTVNKSISEGLNKFNVFAITGSNSPINSSSNLGLNVQFKETPTGYELIIGILLISKGIFSVVLTDLGSQGLRGKDCTNAGFNMTVTNSNKNLNLFQYALGYAPDAMLTKNMYCFRVQ